MKRLDGKRAVVTGGSTGIGFAAAKRFIDEGAEVVITARDRGLLDAAVVRLGPGASGIVSDAGQTADLKSLAGEVGKRFDVIHVLFANAGLSRLSSFLETTEEAFDLQVAVNLKGTFFTIQNLVSLMTEGGSVIINSSATVGRAVLGNSVYAATKAAVATLAFNLSQELLAQHIRVNAILPGAIDTPLYSKIGIPADHLSAALEGFAQMIPLKRFGTAEEVAALVTFLACDESSYVIGDTIPISGGFGTF